MGQASHSESMRHRLAQPPCLASFLSCFYSVLSLGGHCLNLLLPKTPLLMSPHLRARLWGTNLKAEFKIFEVSSPCWSTEKSGVFGPVLISLPPFSMGGKSKDHKGRRCCDMGPLSGRGIQRCPLASLRPHPEHQSVLRDWIQP